MEPLYTPIQLRAVRRIYNGKLVDCSKDDWPDVRSAISREAARMVDQGQHIRAQIMLEEIRRLDRKFAAIEEDE